jgi:adenosylcobinamide kinase / adenosylcobinamide-phosphate guanylyltransferase
MVILITGGSRSGKSTFALELAARADPPRLFLATAQAFDDEMRSRIERHKASRPAEWGLVEEPAAVPAALRAAGRSARTIVVDCVTVWMANLLLADESFGEQEASARARELLESARSVGGANAGTVIIVTNEVGSGIVPDNAISRRFRDCAGRANQVMAAGADEVYFVVSGIPVTLKSSKGVSS